MIKTSAMLLDDLKEYASPKSKLSRMVERGECFQIVKGLYETNKNIPAHLLAGSIYGPSYISFEYALSYYGLIPEAVYTITSATFEKRKRKKYETPFGTFTYQDIPPKAFPLGIKLLQEDGYFYRIATPEKALCDQLYSMPPVPNQKELMRLLIEDLRIDEDDFKKLNLEMICEYSEAYHTTNIKKLYLLLRRFQNEHSN